MAFEEVPSPGPHHQGRHVVVESVVLTVAVEEQVAVGGVADIDLSCHHVVPGGTGGILAVGQEHPGPRVEGVDHHLPLGGSGDLYSAVGEILGRCRDSPVSRPDIESLRQEVRSAAGGEVGLAVDPST